MAERIGFISDTFEHTEDLFERFLFENKFQIEKRGSSWAEFKDGTIVERFYNIPEWNKSHRIDQLIIAGPPAIMMTKESVIINKIAWNTCSNIPEEFRIIRMDFS